MKKKFCVASVFSSLLVVSGAISASSGGAIQQLSDVSDSVTEMIQEQNDSHVKPSKPDYPGHTPQPPKPQQPPATVDTTHAYNSGVRDGAEKGDKEGQRRGHIDGIEQGERDGRRNGASEGESDGYAEGKRDGWGVDQAAGTLNGSREGQRTGTNNGIKAGERRCYDEGYSDAYNIAYADAKQLGLQDAASYSAGYAKGQADAAVTEANNGQKAGYQAGFSQRETELQNSFGSGNGIRGAFEKNAMATRGTDLAIDLVRNGFTTPEEKRAYEKGYKEGYDRAYRRAYEDAKRRSYDESYHRAYRRAYDEQYAYSYRMGYSDGKQQGYQEAYSAAYNSAYNAYFREYKNREYSDQRAEGARDGQAEGRSEGFAAGCEEQTKRGYKAGYEKTAAEVYPGAFEAGKQSGIAAADKYYGANSVLKVFDISFYDENDNGKFEASENVMLRAEIRNFGFQVSGPVAITVKSERGEIVLVPDLRAEGVGGRTKSALSLNIGRLYDVVSPNSDALSVTFTEKGRQVGEFRQVYMRTNANKVGIVAKDSTAVTKKAGWFFPGKITELDSGDKVLIVGEKDDYFRVRKAEFGGGGDWTEGYVNKGKLNLQ